MEETEITDGMTVSTTPAAISIRNAYKRYSATTIVLNGLNLTVPDKSMYELRVRAIINLYLFKTTLSDPGHRYTLLTITFRFDDHNLDTVY